VQQAAVTAISKLGISNPEVLEGLKRLQSEGQHDSLRVAASSTLWELNKRPEEVLDATFTLAQSVVRGFTSHSWNGSGGQGVDGTEQMILQTGNLWARMNLDEAQRERALHLLTTFCEKSGRVFIKMLLLPSMLDLGLGTDAGQEICREGMAAEEDYYQIQAARLMTQLSERATVDEKTVEQMLASSQIGVRAYGANVHWKMHRNAELVLPQLMDALNHSKHQSYYYPEIQQTALATLKKMGPAAAPAKNTLEELRKDPNPELVKLVEEILTNMR
jgi:hypothetical protein